MLALRQQAALSCRANTFRNGWLGLGFAAALLLGAASGAWAQTEPTSSVPDVNNRTTSVGSLPPGIPVKRDTDSSNVDDEISVRWWLAAVCIGGLAAWGFVMVRRRDKGAAVTGAWLGRWTQLAEPGAPREIRRIASTRLTARHSLHVIEWNGRQLLLGCTDQAVQLLSEAVASDQRVAASASQETRAQ
ncbi:flagellar biosynthetic protein FliO [Variovorax boronicumulans]|uniref:flagellar biosynthetic protein FliO n=1 Tax=Variovorax boronicumulans TaxID=436515 RepID=UPI0036F2E176